MQEVFERIVEKLKEISIFMTTCDGYGANCVSVGTIEEIVKQETEKYNNGWIPCSVRLPEDKQTCLVTARIYFTPDHVDEIDNYIGVGIDTYSKQFGWLGTEPIAWQPLPAPYQPKGE